MKPLTSSSKEKDPELKTLTSSSKGKDPELKTLTSSSKGKDPEIKPKLHQDTDKTENTEELSDSEGYLDISNLTVQYESNNDDSTEEEVKPKKTIKKRSKIKKFGKLNKNSTINSDPSTPGLSASLPVESLPSARKTIRSTLSEFFTSLGKKKNSSPNIIANPTNAPDIPLNNSNNELPSQDKTPNNTNAPISIFTDNPSKKKDKKISSIIQDLEKAGFSFAEEVAPGIKTTKHGQELNFCIGLVASIRKRLKNFNNYCIICHVKHSCERVSGRPVVCCEPLCLFRYSDLRVAEHLEECEVCPFLGCSEKEELQNDEEAIKLLYPQEEKQAGIELKKLVQMHRHKYLPQVQLTEFITKMATQGVTAKKVENIIQADLVPRFEKKWEELRTKYPDMVIEPKLAWHGTSDTSIEGIRRQGLLVPGKNNEVGHLNDSGWWGKGIYVSPTASYSVSYMRGNRGLFLVSILLGKTVELGQHERMDGCPVKDGYDSHIAEYGQEYVLFDEGQVLPCYLIEVIR